MTDDTRTVARICRLFANWRGRQPGIPDARYLAYGGGITDPRLADYASWLAQQDSDRFDFAFNGDRTAGDSAHLPVAGEPINNSVSNRPNAFHTHNTKRGR